MRRLTISEIYTVSSYIGVASSGQLIGFTHATLETFYPQFCELTTIDTSKYDLSVYKKFVEVLKAANSHEQAKILRGVLRKLPLNHFEDSERLGIIDHVELRGKRELHTKVSKWIQELEGDSVVPVQVKNDIEMVREALDQCETLISEHSYRSAVDRAHTALHAYLKEICLEANLKINGAQPKIQDYWSKIKSDHPKLQINVKEHNKPINVIVNSISKLLESINEIRNNQSYAHPNEEIIDENDARLMINVSRNLLQYIDSKLSD